MRSGVKSVLAGLAFVALLVLAIYVEYWGRGTWEVRKVPTDTCEYIASWGDMRIYADHMGGAFWRRVAYD